jgi:uncharacterized protein YneF (UPF0154 family)
LVVATVAGAVVAPGVTWGAAVAVGDAVLTGVLDGWVHPVTRRMSMSIRSDTPNVKPAVRFMMLRIGEKSIKASRNFLEWAME